MLNKLKQDMPSPFGWMFVVLSLTSMVYGIGLTIPTYIRFFVGDVENIYIANLRTVLLSSIATINFILAVYYKWIGDE
jgi:hypothetical protein